MRDVKEPEIRRAEIMDAAVQLFTIKGYLNTTTQDIIDKVQISRGLLYYHFKSKLVAGCKSPVAFLVGRLLLNLLS